MNIYNVHKKREKRERELHDPCVYIIKNTKELHTDLYGLCNVYCVDLLDEDRWRKDDTLNTRVLCLVCLVVPV